MKAAILAENRDLPEIDALFGARSGIARSTLEVPMTFPTTAQTVTTGEDFTPNDIVGLAR
jgi:hypothetical protein